MAKVHICNIVVQGEPAPTFMSKLEFEITFECLEALPEDLEWNIIYVGSAESEEYDQVLDTVFVGPVPEGRHKFVFAADAPSAQRIPDPDIVGVTVLLITCSYRNQEFIRVGYYVNNHYEDPEWQETPPNPPRLELLKRNILASSPRVTKFKINWDGLASALDGVNGEGEEMHHHHANAALNGDAAAAAAGLTASSNLENDPVRNKDQKLASRMTAEVFNTQHDKDFLFDNSSCPAAIPGGMDIDL